jgi:hypothetical protein
VNVQATGWQADLEDDGDDVVAELGPFGRFAGMLCRRLVVHVEDDAVAELDWLEGLQGCVVVAKSGCQESQECLRVEVCAAARVAKEGSHAAPIHVLFTLHLFTNNTTSNNILQHIVGYLSSHLVGQTFSSRDVSDTMHKFRCCHFLMMLLRSKRPHEWCSVCLKHLENELATSLCIRLPIEYHAS